MKNIKPQIWPKYSLNEINLVTNVLKSGKVNYWTGKEIKYFEKEFNKYFNLKYTASIANGTLALECAIAVMNLNKGDEIIVTPRSYISSVSCVINAGCKPIFCDIDINSHNIDPLQIEKLITKKTKAIICVHLAGFPCDMDYILQIVKKNKIFLIEDCSQAHGAKYRNKFVGSFGDIATWSFCNDKIISTCGEGGMITTKHKYIYDKILSYRDCGKNFDKISKIKDDIGYKWIHDSIGINARMTEIQATVGRYQLKKLKKFTTLRKNNAMKIWNFCKKINNITIPTISPEISHAGYRCVIMINTNKLKKGWNRNKIIKKLKSFGILCSVGACPEIYLEKYFKKNNIYPNSRLVNAKFIGDRTIAFDINHLLKKQYINNLCINLQNIMNKASV